MLRGAHNTGTEADEAGWYPFRPPTPSCRMCNCFDPLCVWTLASLLRPELRNVLAAPCCHGLRSCGPCRLPVGPLRLPVGPLRLGAVAVPGRASLLPPRTLWRLAPPDAVLNLWRVGANPNRSPPATAFEACGGVSKTCESRPRLVVPTPFWTRLLRSALPLRDGCQGLRTRPTRDLLLDPCAA